MSNHLDLRKLRKTANRADKLQPLLVELGGAFKKRATELAGQDDAEAAGEMAEAGQELLRLASQLEGVMRWAVANGHASELIAAETRADEKVWLDVH